MSRINTAYHNMAVHLSIGVLLAVVLVVIAAFIVIKLKKDKELLAHLDAGLLVFIFIGIIGIGAASVSPLVDYPAWSALVTSPLVQIKIALAFIIFEIFLMMFYIRWKHGANMWNNQKLAFYFLMLAVAGAGLLSIVGAIGGFISIHETSMEKFLHIIGVPIP